MLGFDFLIKIMADGRGAAVEADRVASAVGRINTAASKTSTTLASLGRLLGGIAIIQVISRITREAMSNADALKDMADRTGISVESLQELKYAAETSGTSIEAFATALRMLAVAQSEALGGSTPRLDAFERLGVSLEDLKSKNPEGLLRQISRAMSGGATTSQTIADALEVMGRSADQILPAMRSNIDLLADAACKAGVVIKEDVVNRLAAGNEQWEILMQQVKAQTAEIVSPLVVGVDALRTMVKNIPVLAKYAYHAIGRNANEAAAAKVQYYENWASVYDRYYGKPGGSSAIPIAPPVEGSQTSANEAASVAAAAAKAAVEGVSSGAPPPAVDALARIGLYRGGGESAQVSELRRASQIQQAQLVELRQVNRNLTTE
ncbi:MAG TPA: hypothetical protein P5555_17315 [Candidatus Paceibacterota bacterium]|nr:hypothetical protein [Verrucomicrobiota bacterium]HRZ46939.1 hypothetical protein [Candidatus Paceibacterota bacterium]HRZ92105.1 hypothetical protein [Candidatus Paceibacterota bacterium]